jgi:hypothetical protein
MPYIVEVFQVLNVDGQNIRAFFYQGGTNFKLECGLLPTSLITRGSCSHMLLVYDFTVFLILVRMRIGKELKQLFSHWMLFKQRFVFVSCTIVKLNFFLVAPCFQLDFLGCTMVATLIFIFQMWLTSLELELMQFSLGRVLCRPMI